MIEAKLDKILSNPLSRIQGRDDGIGLVGWDIPEEFILSLDRPVIHLPRHHVKGDGATTPLADQWLESSFAPWAKRIIQKWAQGQFDALSHVIFSRGCDNAQRLYYYVCELQKRRHLAGPTPYIFDVAKIGRPTSLARTVHSLSRLFEDFDLGDVDLEQVIVKTNTRRRLYRDLDNKRVDRGDVYEKISRAVQFADLDDMIQDVDIQGLGRAGKKRILLAGSTPDHGQLHCQIEASGVWSIIGEFHEQSLLRFGPEITKQQLSNSDPITAIANNILANPFGPRSFQNRSTALTNQAMAQSADCVLLWIAEYDEALAWDIPAQCRALTRANIPHLVMTGKAKLLDYSDDVFEFLATQEEE